jgi:hypothetical protein
MQFITIILAVLLLIGISFFNGNFNCSRLAEMQGLKHKYDLITGTCYIRKDFKWVDYNRLKSLED